ncbi:MAG: hydrolase TatD [Gammaproteobacteria bacterium]|nr:hydrolase TatD [Gammaproteobacteria bacterium]
MHDLVDIGANLTHDSFDPDRDAVMQRAADVGVNRIIVTGTSVEATEAALRLAEEYPNRVFATAGVHPHHATEVDTAAIARLKELATHEAVVAVGECGLDFFRNYSPRDVQLQAFETQLRIAADSGKPVFLHQRDAHDPFLALLNEHIADINGGVAHCFTGGREELEAYLELGLYVGITGWICDERRGDGLREAVTSLPLERVLIETDSPYLLPRDLKEKPSGRRNEPSVLPHILETLARHMDQDEQVVAAAATANTERLFGLKRRRAELSP